MAFKKKKSKPFRQGPKESVQGDEFQKEMDVNKTIPIYQGVPEGTYVDEFMPIIQRENYINYMPEAITMPPGFGQPVEIKDGGGVKVNEDKSAMDVIKENTTKDAAKIFTDEKIKNRNEKNFKKTGQYFFKLQKGGEMKKLRGGGIAIKGLKFKGIF